jgi:hypothetical protein
MQDCKPVKVPIHVASRLTTKQFPRTQEEIEEMEHVPSASVFGSLIYEMFCT